MRYYFDIRNGVPVRDKKGMDFDLVSGAIIHAKRLAAELRAKQAVIKPDMRVCVISEQGAIVHEEGVSDQANRNAN